MRVKEGGEAGELLSLRPGRLARGRAKKKVDDFARVQGPAPPLPSKKIAALTETSNGEPIVLANGERKVRVTLISPVLMRIEEIAPGQRFVDDPTYFAM